MKLATGLCVWLSLLVAAGTVQRSASQSGGSWFLLALPGWNLPRLAWLLGWLSLPFAPPDTLWLSGEEGPLHWVLFLGLVVASPSVPKLTICVCMHFYFSWGKKTPLCTPISLSLTSLSSFSHVFWEPERDPFWSRLVCGTWAPQTPE